MQGTNYLDQHTKKKDKDILNKFIICIVTLLFFLLLLSMIRKSYLKTHTLAVGSKQIKMK